MNPFSPRRKQVERRSPAGLPDDTLESVPCLFAASPMTMAAAPRTPVRNPTEIHWHPPTHFKRQDPSTPTTPSSSPHGAASSLPLKSRRLLPPSRRVDDGDDEVGIDNASPMKTIPRAVRKAHYPIFPAIEKEESDDGRINDITVCNDYPQYTNPKTSSPVVEYARFLESAEDLDTFEPMKDSPGSHNYMYRVESIRSMTSKSMASHSTQAEMDFYLHRCYSQDDNASMATTTSPSRHNRMAPPQWVPLHNDTASLTSTASPSSHQRRRMTMLAKSAGNMLRSHRPVWDKTESMRSFCSQASSSVWSLGLGSLGGTSRASSSLYTTSATASRTPTPPSNHGGGSIMLLQRQTSNGTTSTKPRRMTNYANPRVVQQAHRPVPTTGDATNYGGAEERLRQLDLNDNHHKDEDNFDGHCGYNDLCISSGAEKDPVKIPKASLLDDDEAASDLWKTVTTTYSSNHNNNNNNNNTPVAGPIENVHQGDDNHDHDTPSHDSEEEIDGVLDYPWEPQPGGSFMVYRRVN